MAAAGTATETAPTVRTLWHSTMGSVATVEPAAPGAPAMLLTTLSAAAPPALPPAAALECMRGLLAGAAALRRRTSVLLIFDLSGLRRLALRYQPLLRAVMALLRPWVRLAVAGTIVQVDLAPDFLAALQGALATFNAAAPVAILPVTRTPGGAAADQATMQARMAELTAAARPRLAAAAAALTPCHRRLLAAYWRLVAAAAAEPAAMAAGFHQCVGVLLAEAAADGASEPPAATPAEVAAEAALARAVAGVLDAAAAEGLPVPRALNMQDPRVDTAAAAAADPLAPGTAWVWTPATRPADPDAAAAQEEGEEAGVEAAGAGNAALAAELADALAGARRDGVGGRLPTPQAATGTAALLTPALPAPQDADLPSWLPPAVGTVLAALPTAC